MKTLSTFEDWIREAESAPLLPFAEDPFALAAASYRYWVTGRGTRWRELNEAEVEGQDRERGSEMRRYYAGRLLWHRLRDTSGQPLSEFRQKLAGLIEGTYQLRHKDLGLLYRLPYFYAEDLAHDRIFGDPGVRNTRQQKHEALMDVTAKLELQEQVLISRRGRDLMQYWLRSDRADRPLAIVVAMDNPVRSLLESVLQRGPVMLTANWHPQYMRGYHRGQSYYQLGQFKLA